MAWTTPKSDWAAGELVAADDMNEIGENLAALEHPETAAYTRAADISRNARQFADIDTDNLNLTIATGRVYPKRRSAFAGAACRVMQSQST